MPVIKESGDLLLLRRKPSVAGWLGLGWRLAAMLSLLGTVDADNPN